MTATQTGSRPPDLDDFRGAVASFLAGAVDDIRLLFMVGARVADAANYPEWRPGNEFRAIREKQLGR